MCLVNTPNKHDVDQILTKCWSNTGPQSATLAQHQTSTGSAPRVCWELRSISCWSDGTYCWQRLQVDTDPMSVKCWASVAGAVQYPFSPSQFFILAVPACCQYWHDALNESWVIVGPPSVALAHIQRGAKHDTITQYWANVGSAS